MYTFSINTLLYSLTCAVLWAFSLTGEIALTLVSVSKIYVSLNWPGHTNEFTNSSKLLLNLPFWIPFKYKGWANQVWIVSDFKYKSKPTCWFKYIFKQPVFSNTKKKHTQVVIPVLEAVFCDALLLFFTLVSLSCCQH